MKLKPADVMQALQICTRSQCMLPSPLRGRIGQLAFGVDPATIAYGRTTGISVVAVGLRVSYIAM